MVPGWFSTYHVDINMSFVYGFEASNQAYWLAESQVDFVIKCIHVANTEAFGERELNRWTRIDAVQCFGL